jgi:NAD(P)-dependent dehydrogenase (short-subunit alcohol dehydrogenase family)
MLTELNLSEKVVLITGCSSGIGLAAALELRERGYVVVPTARHATDVERLKGWGFRHAFRLDIQDAQSVTKAITTVQSNFGTLLALINNGWSGIPGAIEELPMEALREHFEYVFGTVQLTHGCLPLLRKFDGQSHIIQISSVLGFSPMPFRGCYSAAKAAWEALTVALGMELQHLPANNIGISIIQPGPITTWFRQNSLVNFNRFLSPTNTPYQKCYKRLLSRLDSDKPSAGTLPAEVVVKAILHALGDRPRPYYLITTNTEVMFLVEKFLPNRIKFWLKKGMY